MRNEATWDRIVRVLLGVVVAAIAATMSGAGMIVLWIVAAVLVITGLVGFCPLYRLVGVSTCKR